MEALDTQLAKIQAAEYALAQKRLQLLGTRNQLALIHRLPLELLAEIFCVYCEEDEQISSLNPTAQLPPQLVVCHVCHHWRELAQSTPRLWTNLEIEMYNGNYPDHISMATKWLSRSGSLPIYIRFSTREDNYTAAKMPVPQGVVQFSTSFLHRCTYLSLRLRLPDLIDLLGLQTIHAPLLESVSLQLADPVDAPLMSTGNSLNVGIVTTFNDCPNLEDVHIGTDYHNVGHAAVPVLESMATIKFPPLYELFLEPYLAIAGSGYHDMLLAANPEQVVVKLASGSVSDESWIGDGSIVSLNQTTQFELEFSNVPHGGSWRFVERLTLPLLDSLRIIYPSFDSLERDMDWEPLHLFPILRDLQVRSSAPLTTFVLCYSSYQLTEEILQFLAVVPMLEDLRLLSCNIVVHPLFEALVYQESSSNALLPALKSFVLGTEVPFFPFADEDTFIADFVLSRWWDPADDREREVCRLCLVDIIIYGRTVDPTVLEPMRICKQNGLDLRVKSVVDAETTADYF
ncbi:hypothetical protein GYMLUDRAFT_50607 [Collybiopsis luxurians FD-317 M1]|uniref:F-box domain-containing protein n=1 Tax=Collybiopsis luxurians FD-317 M1 TaxID=944289 RepID=A0A0D0C979_9AGAR|nr:hypothetical protein GYMLUDRAFT_50607 [Collybiopsis luxurians FD-317 M1]